MIKNFGSMSFAIFLCISTFQAQMPGNWTAIQEDTTNNTTLPNVTIPEWDTEVPRVIDNSSTNPIQNPLSTTPDPFASPRVNQALRNFDKEIMKVLFLNSQDFNPYMFNNSLTNADLLSLNNRVYGFNWRNGLFDRMPFPTNTTFPENVTSQRDQGIVLTPLKNRFAPRPSNSRRMECALHGRVVEVNHYFTKFYRIILQFYSPCMSYPIFRYILNKTGLRTTLVIRVMRRTFTFQFRNSYVTRIGQSTVESFREYRLLAPHHHRAFFNAKQYKWNNSTDNLNYQTLKPLTPRQFLAIQAQALEILANNYKKQTQFFDLMDQNREFKSRDEAFPRKTKIEKDNSVEKTTPKKKSDSKKLKAKKKKEKKLLKNRKTELKPLNATGEIIAKRLRKRQLAKNDKLAKDYRHSHPYKKDLSKSAKDRKVVMKLLGGQKIYDKFFRALSIKKPPKNAEKLREKVKLKERKMHPEWTPGWRSNWWQLGEHMWENRYRPVLYEIINNEPYKVATCQRICSMNDYYHSWDFCLRVCGFNYNFLSNVQDPYNIVTLFPNIPWIRVASTLFYLPRNGRFNEDPNRSRQYSLRSMTSFWQRPQVLTCHRTWTRLTCRL